MKVLIIHVGTPVNPALHQQELLLLEPTLTKGLQYFREAEVINNTQTRKSLVGKGLEVDHVYFTGRKNPLHCIKASWALRRMVLKNNYDIVHQYWGGMASFFASIYCPVHYIISFLGSDLYGQYKPNGSKTLMGKALRFFSQLTAIFASGVVVMSQKMKEELWRSSQKKAVVFCEGISVQKFYPIQYEEAKKHLQWDMATPIVLFFSSEAYVKNMPLALAAFHQLKQALTAAQLVLVKGVPHQDLVWYYNAADLLLITSYHEGSNNSIKEALACNLPVVSVNVGDATERLSQVNPSAVVHSFNEKKIAEAMLPILIEKKRSNGANTVHEVELLNIAQKIISYYHSILFKK